MSVYFVEKKGWRYDFMLKGQRYTKAWFQTKREAKQAEEGQRKYLMTPTPTDMPFLILVNKRLDEVKQRLSVEHYMDTVYHARRWVSRWEDFTCSQITREMITDLRNERSKVSNETANKELRHLKALFNWGLKSELIVSNPAANVPMMRIEKKRKRIPTQDEINKILEVATTEQQDYLWCLRETLGRSREINGLTWDDVDFNNKTVTLYTRKKKHRTRTPRVIPMTSTLFNVLSERHSRREVDIPWVFWHRYRSRKVDDIIMAPFQDRKKFMRTLCTKANVPYFRFHPLRHAGASLMDAANIPIASIQDILGHKCRKTTEIYFHANEESKVIAMKIYEDTRKAAPTLRLDE
jgi:integrase